MKIEIRISLLLQSKILKLFRLHFLFLSVVVGFHAVSNVNSSHVFDAFLLFIVIYSIYSIKTVPHEHLLFRPSRASQTSYSLATLSSHWRNLSSCRLFLVIGVPAINFAHNNVSPWSSVAFLLGFPPYNPVKCEVLIKKYLRSILDISAYVIQKQFLNWNLRTFALIVSAQIHMPRHARVCIIKW